MPMRPIEKRRLIGNYHKRITQSVPAEGIFSNKTEVERQIVACVVCARIKWIDEAFPCAMWVPYPENRNVSAEVLHTESESAARNDEGQNKKRTARED